MSLETLISSKCWLNMWWQEYSKYFLIHFDMCQVQPVSKEKKKWLGPHRWLDIDYILTTKTEPVSFKRLEASLVCWFGFVYFSFPDSELACALVCSLCLNFVFFLFWSPYKPNGCVEPASNGCVEPGSNREPVHALCKLSSSRGIRASDRFLLAVLPYLALVLNCRTYTPERSVYTQTFLLSYSEQWFPKIIFRNDKYSWYSKLLSYLKCIRGGRNIISWFTECWHLLMLPKPPKIALE